VSRARYVRVGVAVLTVAGLGVAGAGCALDFSDATLDFPKPTAEFVSTVPPSTTTPRDVNFDASASQPSTPQGRGIEEYIWDWNSDAIADWESDSPTTTAQLEPGVHTVSLVAHEALAYSNPVTHPVTVPEPSSPPPPPPTPTVVLAPLPEVLCIGKEVTLDASGSTPTQNHQLVQFEWDLGRGKFDVDTQATPKLTYVFDTPAIFKVAVRATDDSGASNTAGIEVKVSNCGAGYRAHAAAAKLSFTATFIGGGKAPPMRDLLDYVNSRVLRGKMRTGLFPDQAGQLSSAVPSLNGDVAARLQAKRRGSNFSATGLAAVRSTGGRAGWTCLRVRLQTKSLAVTGTFRTIGGTGPLADQHVQGKLDALLSSRAPLAGGDTTLRAQRGGRTPPECEALARRLGVRG
jgi:hypothetical protein